MAGDRVRTHIRLAILQLQDLQAVYSVIGKKENCYESVNLHDFLNLS